jgi:hypothetical protein
MKRLLIPKYKKLLPALQQPESPFIEKILREMDDVTKQDDRTAFETNRLTSFISVRQA